MRVYKVAKKYKFPKGCEVAEIFTHQEAFYLGITLQVFKNDLIPKMFDKGWFVIDLVKSDHGNLILTLGKPE